jgi:hypothetical protein
LEVAERETELAVLSAVAHGNKPNGLAVVQAALVALAQLDREHAAVYFQIICNGLREPMQRALEALVMEPIHSRKSPSASSRSSIAPHSRSVYLS